MTTQKITSILNKSGFKAFRKYSKKVNGVYVVIRENHFNVFNCNGVIGVETFGIETENQLQALLNAGVNAQETVKGSGLIKILK